MDELDEPTCWRLLSRARFGRVGFVRDGEVIVVPVNAIVARDGIAFRTANDTSLAAAGDGAAVAFEADHTDQVAESGWSVLVRGRLWSVTGDTEIAELRESNLRPWAPAPRDHWMKIAPTGVTGRMIQRHRNLPPGCHVPYMAPD